MAKRHHSHMSHKGHFMERDVMHSDKHEGAYGGPIDKRRGQEARDGSMIDEDHNAIANLPQQVMMKQYGELSESYLTYGHINDSVTGVDEQRNHNAAMQRKLMHPNK